MYIIKIKLKIFVRHSYIGIKMVLCYDGPSTIYLKKRKENKNVFNRKSMNEKCLNGRIN